MKRIDKTLYILFDTFAFPFIFWYGLMENVYFEFLSFLLDTITLIGWVDRTVDKISDNITDSEIPWYHWTKLTFYFFLIIFIVPVIYPYFIGRGIQENKHELKYRKVPFKKFIVGLKRKATG